MLFRAPTGLCLCQSSAWGNGQGSKEQLVNLGRRDSPGSFQSPSEIAAVLQTWTPCRFLTFSHLGATLSLYFCATFDCSALCPLSDTLSIPSSHPLTTALNQDVTEKPKASSIVKTCFSRNTGAGQGANVSSSKRLFLWHFCIEGKSKG